MLFLGDTTQQRIFISPQVYRSNLFVFEPQQVIVPTNIPSLNSALHSEVWKLKEHVMRISCGFPVSTEEVNPALQNGLEFLTTF